METEYSFQYLVLGHLDTQKGKKINFNLYLTPYTKVDSK